MSVMIWDSAAQAFAEPQNVPMRNDQESGAWVETTGKSWDAQSQAWAEKWPNKLWLYKDGDECVDVTGGWGNVQTANGTCTQKDSYIEFNCNASDLGSLICCLNPINTKNYKKMYVEYSLERSVTQNKDTYFQIVCCDRLPTSWGDTLSITGYTAALDKSNTHVANGVIAADIPSNMQVCFFVQNSQGLAKLYKVWLEQ